MLPLFRTRAFQNVLRTIVVIIVFTLWLYTSLTTTIFWGMFLVWAVWRLDSRYVGAGALALLVAIPIVLSLGEEEWGWLAEQFAVYVFFLLCITVGLQMLEMMVSGTRENELPSEKSTVDSSSDSKWEVESESSQTSTGSNTDVRSPLNSMNDLLPTEHSRVAQVVQRSDTTRTTHDQPPARTRRYATPQHRRYAEEYPNILDLRPRNTKTHETRGAAGVES